MLCKQIARAIIGLKIIIPIRNRLFIFVRDIRILKKDYPASADIGGDFK